MAQVATQKTTGSTRFRGPTIIKLAGGGAHDALLKGDGLDVGLSIHVTTAQSANAFQIEQPSGTIISAFDAAGGLVFGALKVSHRAVRVPLSAAQITTLHSVPISLVAAPGAGLALVLRAWLFQFIFGTVQFTGGGVVNPVYHGAAGTNLAAGSVAAASIQAAANYTGFSPAAAGGTALAISTNTGIDLSAGTADFAAGDSTAVVTAFYDLVTLG